MKKEISASWGELRSLIHSPPGQDVFFEILAFLRKSTHYGLDQSRKEYVMGHISRWDKSSRTGWQGDFANGLEWMTPCVYILKPEVFVGAKLSSFKKDVRVQSPCAEIELLVEVNGMPLGRIANYTSRGISAEGIEVYAWEMENCRVELEIVPYALMNYDPPLSVISYSPEPIEGGYLATWCMLPRAELGNVLLKHRCLPLQHMENWGPDTGERFESITWVSQANGIESRMHLHLGTPNDEGIEKYLKSCWARQPAEVFYEESSLSVGFCISRAHQDILVRSSIAWGMGGEDYMGTHLASDDMFTMRDLPLKAT